MQGLKHLIEKELVEKKLDGLKLDEEDIVLFLCDCRGKILSSETSGTGLIARPPDSSRFLKKLEIEWTEHSKRDCEYLGSFERSDGSNFLVTHFDEDEEPEDFLVSLKIAVDDMLSKIPSKCTINSVQFNKEVGLKPTWDDIQALLDKMLSYQDGVKWVVWKKIEGEEGESSTQPPAVESLGYSTSSVSFEKREQSVELLHSILEEMQAVDSFYDGKEPKNPRPEHPKPVSYHRRSQSFCPSQFTNVRNSIEVAKERKQREKTSPPKKDRLPFKVFPQLIRRTSL